MKLKDFESKVMDIDIPELRIVGFMMQGGHVTRCVARSTTFVVVWLWSGRAYVNYPDAETLALGDDELADKYERIQEMDITTGAEADGVDWWREYRYDIQR